MNGLRMLALGVGNAFSARYYSACLALEAEGAWLLIDCPHPIRKIVREAAESAGLALDIDQFAAVALSHLHADHSSGLEGYGFYHRFIRHRPAALLAHPDVSARLWDHHLAGGMETSASTPGEPPVRRCLEEFFQLTALDTARPVQVGPFAVECRHTRHGIPTTAFRVRGGGRCLGYSADTAYDPTLIDWLASADTIVHETNTGSTHTPYESLAALPAGLRSKMRLIHYPDDFDGAASVIEPLRQGRRYEV